MLYLKPAITGAEPQYVLDYRYRNASFPHEGILDQIFEEEQFEGYRAVGECAAESLFRPEIVDDTPKTVRAWFQKLADSLLPDNGREFFIESQCFNLGSQLPQRIDPVDSAGGRVLNQVVKTGFADHHHEVRHAIRQMDANDYRVAAREIRIDQKIRG